MVIIRKVTANDKAALLIVEEKSTPKLQYLPQVFDMFLNDARGEFMLAELDGEIVGCAKFTVLANGTAWLETLRVIPEVQGQGIGKKLYARFAEVTKQEKITTMRMYTGLNNAVSKGLAEYSDFSLEETFFGFTKACQAVDLGAGATSGFKEVSDVNRAAELILPHAKKWHDFAVMNRTFYKLNAEQCASFVEQGQVFEDASTNSLIVCGARFMPEQALHIALFAGDAKKCLGFAEQQAFRQNAQQVSCFFPTAALDIKDTLLNNGFQESPAPFIVMSVKNS